MEKTFQVTFLIDKNFPHDPSHRTILTDPIKEQVDGDVSEVLTLLERKGWFPHGIEIKERE